MSNAPDAPPYPQSPELEEPSPLAYAEILTFQWCFGINKDIPVLNLSINSTKKIFYVASQIGVLYDFSSNKQQLLIGHRNNISCCCVSDNKRWLVTADSGPDCTIIVWDTISGLPNQTYFDVLNGGANAVAISFDSKYIATLSKDGPQIMSIWDWTSASDEPLCAVELKKEYDNQYFIRFNNRDASQLVSNSTTQVLFYDWNPQEGITCFDPELTERTFNSSREKLGYLTQSTFLLNSTQAITATTTGKLVLWDCKLNPANVNRDLMSRDNTNMTNKRDRSKGLNREETGASSITSTNRTLSSGTSVRSQTKNINEKEISDVSQKQDRIRKTLRNDNQQHSLMNKKALKLCEPQKKAITVLTTVDDLVITGDSDGIIRFFDQELKLRMWYQHFKLGPIKSISFTFTTTDYTPTETVDDKDLENETTLAQPKFITPDYIISSTTACIGHISSSGSKIQIIKRDSDSAIYALVTHPFESKLCFGNCNGRLQLWDYDVKQLITSAVATKVAVTSLQYNHNASCLAIGYRNGELQLCDPLSLESILRAPFKYARSSIEIIQFSNDSNYLATAEEDFTVSVYRQNLFSQEVYTFLGRYRAHYKQIRSMFFGLTLDDNLPRLITIGSDRVLSEFDLLESDFDNLILKTPQRVEQTCVPMCACWYPPGITKESFLLTANSEYKYKLFNSETKMCRKTTLGPTFGSPLRKIQVLPQTTNQNKHYLYFMTQDKVGLQRLPLTGNPYDQMAVIMHPNKVADVVSSFDGKYLFSSGGLDSTIHMLKVNTDVLDVQSNLGGADLIPFYKLLEGGREGDIFKEMQDLFYYSQLRYQGLDRFDRREVAPVIPLSEIPFVMRALGYYPTEQEIEEMLNEVKFSKYVDTNTYVEEIDLNDFIKLYINHRPAFGLNPSDLYQAFEVLGDNLNSKTCEPEITRENLLYLLQTFGEHMSEYELADCLCNLLNLQENIDDMNTADASEFVESRLPNKITLQSFMEELLKMPSQYVEQCLYTVLQLKRPITDGNDRSYERQKSIRSQQSESRASTTS
ncbi:unnamed protein product [Didymodactylos carnosus]|uniref:Cilia- and flagella-associated protein 251 n=1 Tax=Didymodactylos carnosus TaxID=1234261 RepID=A0A814VJG2_9BILA|nr:unnamed protein product [Didymodactylos carnosus]CAF3954060.1 unnamed protein product [Didymodactylos carnosus]